MEGYGHDRKNNPEQNKIEGGREKTSEPKTADIGVSNNRTLQPVILVAGKGDKGNAARPV